MATSEQFGMAANTQPSRRHVVTSSRRHVVNEMFTLLTRQAAFLPAGTDLRQH